MLKRLGAVAVALAPLSIPSVAYAAPTEVDGNRFPASGLAKLVQGCNDPNAVPVEAPKFLVKRGPGNPPPRPVLLRVERVGQPVRGWVSGPDEQPLDAHRPPDRGELAGR